MKDLAIEQQQCFYELLCDCMIYQPGEHKYLKQNIGYALFGPPNNNENTNENKTNVYCNKENHSKDKDHNEDEDVTDAVDYKDDAKALIHKIYCKILEYTIETDYDKPIYCGIIYNVVICHKLKKPKKSKEIESNTEDNENLTAISVQPIPIFKTWKFIMNKEKSVEKKKEATEKSTKANEEYKIWYIDTTGRVYENWADYKTNNNLFECTMVLPKDGTYQPDPSCPITEDYSTVWLEIMDSPACSLAAKVRNGMDIASTVTGAGALTVGVASLFTPLAPVVVVGGVVATGVSATWAMIRGTQQLRDRSVHKESINPLDAEAFPQWLTITSSVFGLGAMGGAAAISAAVSRGMTVNTAARLVFNTIQSGNLFLNGIGIIYQSYCLVDRYRTDGTINYFEVVSMATHLMFFAGTVVNIQFASKIIRNNQGKILDDYRQGLRSKRLRKQYNRVKRVAAANNTCEMSENAEVIRYIKNRNQLASNTASNNASNASVAINKTTDSTKPSIIIWTIENGILTVNGIQLLDPLKFVTQLIRSGMPNDSNQDNTSNKQRDERDFQTTKLWSILDDLLLQFNLRTNNSSNNINTSEFIPLLREMDSLNVNQDLLKKLFKIAIRLIQHSQTPLDFLLKTMRFIWLYCKKNFKQWGIQTCLRMQSFAGFNILFIVITALFEAEKLDSLYLAFEKYVGALRYAV
ncbi:hypothetical protein EAI_08116 [Harpegnathos saltator]|uniref:DUF4781 domain-containing protein n=2 Tax=Harpegnathos saltator TaxID=610380 RepID=E2C1G8_HARSA|nr:hypothetical protein EAI_08116 [Harpegnathos saltator]